MFDGDKCIGGIQSEAEIRIEIPGLQKSTILVQGTKKVFQTGQSLLAAEKVFRYYHTNAPTPREKNPCRKPNPLRTSTALDL